MAHLDRLVWAALKPVVFGVAFNFEHNGTVVVGYIYDAHPAETQYGKGLRHYALPYMPITIA